MTDKFHPTKQTTTTATSAAAPIPKIHLHTPTRHPYRPNPTSRHRHNRRNSTCRRCFCLTCIYSLILLLFLLLLAATASAAFNVLYHPHRPSFAVAAVKISSFNLTTAASDDTSHLSTTINITLSAKNPNKRITFFYDAVSIAVLSNAVNLSNGSFTNFTGSPNSIFVIHAVTAVNSQILDADSVKSLNSGLKRKTGLPMNIVMDTMVGVKMEKLKMKKIGIRVNCEGIHGVMPKGKNVISVANTSKAKCRVDLRFKILKRSFL
ncbi:hypothetical protein BUALT_Bualt05G0011700 [Buddleja alternifolia]|uniref:Late embryogenesis abundant protein LEA-2 subgroup domain-containing protein n=1 Tax=Buddleja alternifolia TaxID=168488 RepID=A0AAV6XML7_9LAMI|nr:hypothetical protein BUALT_Bualt05G0011700 [Buddleja alternifolia]